MQATIYNLAGKEVEQIDLDDAIFGVTPNHAVIQQAVLRQQANARQGTHDTKTRADVSGGGKKPWRQKGTGRARQGSTRSPQWRHGGVVFGPHPRSYEKDMPRKMRRLAIRGVLSGKLADGQLMIVDSFETLEPRTKSMVNVLKSLNIGEKKTLIFTTGDEATLKQAAGNLPHVKMIDAHYLSIVDMLTHDVVVLPRAAVDVVTGILGNTGGRRKLVLRGVAASNDSSRAATTTTTARAEVVSTASTTTSVTATAETEAPAAKPARKPAVKAVTVEAEAPAEVETAAPAASTKKARTSIAAGTMKIGNVHYSGEESVEVQNTNDLPIDISGYVLRDKNDPEQSFTFPEGVEVNAGGHITVFTAPGHRYTFNSKRPIWNDKGDQIELLDASGKVLDTYSYGSYADDATGADNESEG
ncbi:MAG: 50S ribosomal protein L4 [Chloroflexota bacterium]